MAFDHQWVADLSLTAGADLSSDQFKIVKLDGSGDAILAAAAGEVVTGVLQNKPKVTTEEARVRVMGVSKVKAGAAISIGDLIATDALGLAKTAVLATTDTTTSNTTEALVASHVIGQALQAASGSGEIISCLLFPMGAAATTAA